MGHKFDTYNKAYYFRSKTHEPKKWKIIHHEKYWYVIHENDIEEWKREIL